MRAYKTYSIFSSIRQLHDHHHVVPLEPVHLLHLLLALPQKMLKSFSSKNKSYLEYILKSYDRESNPHRLL